MNKKNMLDAIKYTIGTLYTATLGHYWIETIKSKKTNLFTKQTPTETQVINKA